MSRCIDADALFREMEKAQWYNNADRDEIAEELVLNALTIEPRCEVCEAFNKTRLLIPQPERKKGKWIKYEQEFRLEGQLETVQKTVRECSICRTKIADMVGIMNFCPNCGAMMEGE